MSPCDCGKEDHAGIVKQVADLFDKGMWKQGRWVRLHECNRYGTCGLYCPNLSVDRDRAECALMEGANLLDAAKLPQTHCPIGRW